MRLRLTNSRETYGVVHQTLHWLTAVLIICMFALGMFMRGLPVSDPAEIARAVWWFSLHKTVGMATLTVVLLRIFWAVVQPHPVALKGGLEGFAAKTVHWLLYGSMILMPVTGWLHHAAAEGFAPIWWPLSQDLPFVPKDPDVSRFFGISHWVLAVTMAGALLLHVAGALKHAIIDRDQVLARMLPGAYRESGSVPEDSGGQTPAILVASAALAVACMSVVGLYAWQSEGGSDSTVVVERTFEGDARAAGTWAIDHAASELAFEILQMNAAVKGVFTDWRADVVFDPDQLASASIEARVNIGSLSLPEVATQALSADFLNAEAHPTATFSASQVVATESGFEARGTLTIAGTEKPFVLPFTFREDSGRALVAAEAMIERLSFGIGKTHTDDSTVGRQVKLSIAIEATR